MTELRSELLQNQAQLVDLAKWKLLVVGAIAVTGLGWSSERGPSPQSGVLLLFVNQLRDSRKLGLLSDRWAHLLSSVVFALGLPFLAWDRYQAALDWRTSIPAVGLLSVLVVFASFTRSRSALVRDENRTSQVDEITPIPAPARR